MQQEIEGILAKLADLIHNDRDIRDRMAILLNLKQQAKMVEDSCNKTVKTLTMITAEVAMLTDRMGRFYAELNKERIKSRVLACYEDFHKVMALEALKRSNPHLDSEVSLLNIVGASERSFHEAMEAELRNMVSVLMLNELLHQTEMRKLNEDYSKEYTTLQQLKEKFAEFQKDLIKNQIELRSLTATYKNTTTSQAGEMLKKSEENRKKTLEYQSELRGREATRERKYDTLITLYERINHGYHIRIREANKALSAILKVGPRRHRINQTFEFHTFLPQTWLSMKDIIIPIIHSQPAGTHITDETFIGNPKALKAWQTLKRINPKYLNEKRYKLSKYIRRYYDQLTAEQDLLKRNWRNRTCFIHHQRRRLAYEENTEEIYVFHPIELPLHYAVEQQYKDDSETNLVVDDLVAKVVAKHSKAEADAAGDQPAEPLPPVKPASSRFAKIRSALHLPGSSKATLSP